MRSPIYWHPRLYQLAIRLLYGKHYRDRYAAIASRIATGVSVVDLCCGDCRLFTQELAGRAGSYLGLELNERFVRRARTRGITASVWDFRVDPVPPADVVILQGSLYQAVPDHVVLIERMLRAARHAVIIAEPVKNLSTSGHGAVSWIAQHMANPGTQHMATRFTEQSLRELFSRFPLIECVPIAGGRELCAVFDARVR
jgi:trans-aconitate methyltransferase